MFIVVIAHAQLPAWSRYVPNGPAFAQRIRLTLISPRSMPRCPGTISTMRFTGCYPPVSNDARSQEVVNSDQNYPYSVPQRTLWHIERARKAARDTGRTRDFARKDTGIAMLKRSSPTVAVFSSVAVFCRNRTRNILEESKVVVRKLL